MLFKNLCYSAIAIDYEIINNIVIKTCNRFIFIKPFPAAGGERQQIILYNIIKN